MKIAQLYKYSWFANLAYVKWDGLNTVDSAKMIAAANAAQRIPGRVLSQVDNTIDTLGERIFRPTSDGQPGGLKGLGWKVLSFQPNDPAGFAASLYGDGHEKVLAIRGTETDGIQTRLDLLQADLEQIGGFGIAIDQLCLASTILSGLTTIMMAG